MQGTARCADAVARWSPTTLRQNRIKIGAKIVRHVRYVTFRWPRSGVAADVRANPGVDRPIACAASAGLTLAAVSLERNIARDLCLDDETHGHGHHKIAPDASPGGKRSALPPRIELWTAVEARMAFLIPRTGAYLGNVGLL